MGRAAILLAMLITVPAVAQTAANKQAAKPPAKPAASMAQPKQAQRLAKKVAVTPKKRPAKLAKAKPAKPKQEPAVSPAPAAAYVAMPVTERRAIQSDLIWAGDYNGVIGDEFGERAIAAVKAYQARAGSAETGILAPEQRSALAAAAKARQDASGWRVVDDAVTGARLAVPIKYAPQSSTTGSGTRWSSSGGEVQIETFRIAESGTTLAAVFEQQKKEPADRQVEYGVLRESFFVLSGLQGPKRFYVRAQVRGNDVRGVTIMYDQAMQGIMGPVAVAMSSRFEPFPGAPAVLPHRRKVEYATGIVIDDLGHVITDRYAVDGCYVITLAGFGGAERIAERGNLALLRIYGARHLKAVPIGVDGAAPAEVTLVGIADPQAQGGNSAVSAIKARTDAAENDGRTLTPAPALGFSGAAALDAQGGLAGMAALKSAVVAGPASAAVQAELVPIETIRAFLKAQNVAPGASAPSGIAAAKRSVVRVICVRR